MIYVLRYYDSIGERYEIGAYSSREKALQAAASHAAPAPIEWDNHGLVIGDFTNRGNEYHINKMPLDKMDLDEGENFPIDKEAERQREIARYADAPSILHTHVDTYDGAS